MSSAIDAGAAQPGERVVMTDPTHVLLVEIVAQRSNPAMIDLAVRILGIIAGAETERVQLGATLELQRACGYPLANWWLRDLARFAASHPWAQAPLEPYLPAAAP